MKITEEAIKKLREMASKLFNIEVINEPQELDLSQIEREMSKVKGSRDARNHIASYLQNMGIKIKTEAKINAKTWHSYILYTEPLNMLITYKGRWLTNFGKMFNLGDKEGTGLNQILAQFAIDNFVDVLVIVTPDKTTYHVNIKDLVEFAGEHNTGRQFRGMTELHIPIDMLQDFPPLLLRKQ